ncbi:MULTISPECIES: iron-containing alcohol dehydrogenase [Pandoraea]|jgi:alcohol dehydrogenase class IV|uniref:Alcohol dehydrogenase n=1 Tax=Pandoraea pnomenusa TaxID=93220 RepID=A0ABY6WRT7_9BURK|nr:MULTISPECIES: iron-containing alcohol dehydrogenase [Pandoraea]AHB04898.1 alcohol dehydrogenase [Pandoraea pnomenusa 3kgm]AHB74731.1 alcohol dehydrogenase [Pandoraea pnomenusa]AHN76925.1 alcohol dehydrogenase [Pandoraea pnomenusa]MBN9094263.1 iron-containing alcohol dehydrogenase [Pandoraea pnomenusa]QDH60931.1 iron-containing alcohol dehydrogenase [Pandoraea pnomenusa]
MRIEDCIHFCAPSRLVIELGYRHKLPRLLQTLGYRRGVLVTDAFFAHKTPWVSDYVAACARLGIHVDVYAAGAPDPTTDLCDRASAELRGMLGTQLPDHVVSLGGGSNIDLAKALCLTLASGRPIRDYGAGVPTDAPVIDHISMPTTAGTGSELTPGTILFDPETGIKTAVMDNRLRPVIAVIDPELTFTCPPRVTAESGLDALTHALESFVTLDSSRFDRAGSVDPGYSGRNGLTMIFARESIRLAAKYLVRCYENGGDVEARVGMCYASVYAAMSYGSAGLNAVHGIAYGVAALTHKSHGATNAVVLPYVIDALTHSRRAELLEVARLFGIDTSDEDQAVRALPRALRDLVGRLGIPTDLDAFGVAQASLDHLLADSLGVTRLAKAFPVGNIEASYAQIIDNAWRGALRDEKAERLSAA